MAVRALPVIGLAAGTTMMMVGSSQVSAAWLARDLSPRDRWTMGLVAASFVGLGTVLQILASRELAQGAHP